MTQCTILAQYPEPPFHQQRLLIYVPADVQKDLHTKPTVIIAHQLRHILMTQKLTPKNVPHHVRVRQNV